MTKLFEKLKEYWKDAVWSKVIAAGIIFVLGTIFTTLYAIFKIIYSKISFKDTFESIEKILTKEITIQIWFFLLILIVFLIFSLIFVLGFFSFVANPSSSTLGILSINSFSISAKGLPLDKLFTKSSRLAG